MEFTPVRVLVISIFALWLGGWLTSRVHLLRRFSIPVAVTGGLACAVVLALAEWGTGFSPEWDMTLRDTLLLVFFSGVGTSAKFSKLRAGGRLFGRLALLTVAFLVLQNLVGVIVALIIGRDAAYGLICGSVAFAGGHGTAITWGHIAGEWGYPHVLSHGIAFATFGLIAGGLVGGPLASRLIRLGGFAERHDATGLRGRASDTPPPERAIALTSGGFLRTLLVFAICVAAGSEFNRLLAHTGVILPGFVTAMLVGVLLANLADAIKQPLQVESVEFLGDISLNLFLAMSLVSLELAHFSDAVLPVAFALTAQIVFAVLFARWVVFRYCGGDYDAAVIATGFVGIGLGATPVGMANMEAVTSRYRPSPTALLVLPLIGAGVLDVANAIVIEIYLKILM